MALDRAQPARSTRAPRGTLTADRILDAAIRIIDDEGIDALTMARLAAELDVKPMSLYTHYRDKGAILRAATTVLFDRVEVPPRTIPDLAHLRNVIAAYFRVLVDNPVLLEIDRSEEGITESEARVYEELYACMRHLGVTRHAATGLVATLLRYATGSAHLYRARRQWDDDRDYWNRYRNYLGDLPEESYPSMHWLWDEFPVFTQDETFEFGLDALIATVKNYASDPKDS